MPLHRDIHWIGRQWAVTGHGMQLIDQKLQGFFDIEVSKLWDDVLVEAMHAKEWLNTADFEKALAIARARYPQPAGIVASPAEPRLVTKPVAPMAAVAKPVAPKPEAPRVETPRVETSRVETPRAETSRVETPRVDTPRVETPKLEKPNPIAPRRAASKPEAPEPKKPDPVEPPRAVAEVQPPAIATPVPPEPRPSSPPTLFQMRYEGRARFVRPWRVVARKF
ncbi:hypothetical protein [Afipia sp. GAS231]|uniref:hypothetical protein n=1 Tax=Afipia sp. GAS231 TaxID=1882747 RepID=UPI00087A0DFC|nr:hypothetical protein [Afipia sp. GAS231]SDM91457.1 hypothetical protein SAMN05444050_0171 [Afipia sp. GAS231]